MNKLTNRRPSIRLTDAEAEFLVSESVKQGISVSEVIRRAIWSQASAAALADRLDEIVTREVERARGLLDDEFELQKASLIAALDQANQINLGRMVEWMNANLTTKNGGKS